jgi:hypothetical protein
VKSRFRRRVGEAFNQDWLEISLTALGVLFLVMFGFCVWGLVTVIVHWGDSTSGLPIGQGMFQTSKGFGLAIFSVGAIVTFAVGWWLAGGPIWRRLRALGHRSDQAS